MSTVHETLVARQCGMEVFGFSLITNVCVTKEVKVDHATDEVASVEEVMDTAAKRAEDLKGLVKRMAKVMQP